MKHKISVYQEDFKKSLEKVISADSGYYKYVMETLGFSQDDLLQAIYEYNAVSSNHQSNAFYSGVLAPATLDFHGKVIRSYHRIRERCIEDFLVVSRAKKVVEIGFGYPSTHITTLCLKEGRFTADLFDFSKNILKYAECALSYCDKNWKEKIKLGYHDMNSGEYIGDYDTYILLDSVEHAEKPTEYLKQLVKKAPVDSKFIFSIPIGKLKGGSLEDFHHIEWPIIDDSRKWLNDCGLEIILETPVETVRGIDHFAEFLPDNKLVCHLTLCQKIK